MDTGKILEFFEKRSSVRAFTAQEVTAEAIENIIHAASLAPTARNVQPWAFIVVRDEAMRSQIARLTAKNAPFIAEAPVCIAIACQDTRYYLEDGCSATTQLLLCAALMGLGACWVAAGSPTGSSPWSGC